MCNVQGGFDISLINDANSDLMLISGEIENNGMNDGISIVNNSISGMDISDTAKITNKTTDTIISNTAGDFTVFDGAQITNTESGNIKAQNNGGKFTIAGLLKHFGEGKVTVENNGDEKIDIQATANINTSDGDIKITNTSAGDEGGIDIAGIIKADKQNIEIANQNSDIRIGENSITNNNYITAQDGSVVINQINGNVLNNITDATLAYKTLAKSNGDVTLNVVNGNIGSANNISTESINLDVSGSIIARAVNNENGVGSRLVNIRAINSNGNTVSFDALQSDDAYVNAPVTNLNIKNGLINKYAQLRNKDKTGIVDNANRWLHKNADVQLYTAKTGSFALNFDRTINMHTNAPVVYNNPHMLVNGYHSEQSFVNLGQKEAKDRKDRIDAADTTSRNNNKVQKSLTLRFDAINDKGLSSNYKIYDISTTGAIIKNDGSLKRGKTTTINIKFDDIDIDVKAKVVSIKGDFADIEFKDLPKDVANLILYRYMQNKDSMKISTNEQ